MSSPETCSFSQFAGIARVKRSYITQLKKEGRLVLTDDGKAVRVAESLARIEATRSPAHQGVADRHAHGRGVAHAAEAHPPAPTTASAPAQAEVDDEAAIAASPHSERRAKALADKEEAAARKALRDEQLELGQLLLASDVEAVVADAATTLRVALEALPYDLAPMLAPITDESLLRAKLVEVIEGLLHELARQFGAATKPMSGKS